MIAKKIVSAIIISGFLVSTGIAQNINKFEKFQDRLKKGNSTLGINLNLFQLIETRDLLEFNIGPSIEYSYFLVNRFSINASLKYVHQTFSYYQTNTSAIRSQKSIDLWFRYYLFKRGGFFIDLGGSFGHILIIDNSREFEFGRKFYAAPKVTIGYSYMISNMWQKIDNKVSVNFSIHQYVPYKRRANFDVCDWYIPYFPMCYFEFGVVYYFKRK